MSEQQPDLGKLGEDFIIEYFKSIGRAAFKNHNPSAPVYDLFVEGLNGVQVKTQAPFFSKASVTVKGDAFLRYKEFGAKIIAVTYPLADYKKPSHTNLTNRALLIDPNKCQWEDGGVSVKPDTSVYKKVIIPIWRAGTWADGVSVLVENLNQTAKEIGFKYKDYLKYDLTTAMMRLSNHKEK